MKAWYEKTFGRVYLDIYSHRDEREARRALKIIERIYSPVIEKRGRRSLRILDLGSGQGRYTRLLAQAGHEVVGLDLSRELLLEARGSLKENPPAKGRLWYVRADMRDIPFSRQFDLVINMFTSFGYFSEDSENSRVLTAVAQALKPGGMFIIDYLNREKVLRTLVQEDSYRKNGLIITQWRRMSEDGLRVEKKVCLEGPGRRECFEESVRLYSRQEMERMLSQAGLVVVSLFGDYDGALFRDDSPRLIISGIKYD